MSANSNTPAKRWTWLWMALAVLLVGALALAAACGGDDDDDGGNGGDDDGGSSPTATQPAADDDDDGGDDDGGDDDGGDITAVLDEIEGLAEDYEGATGTVTYDFTSEGETITWTYVSDGESSRVEVAADDGTFVSISTPDTSYFCSESEGEGFCFEGEGGGVSNPFLPIFNQYSSSDAIFGYLDLFTDVDVDESSEDIAGVDANCYAASGDFGSESGTIKWCFSDSGVLLLSQYNFDGETFEMRATDFSDDIAGDAFEPPYEVTTFG